MLLLTSIDCLSVVQSSFFTTVYEGSEFIAEVFFSRKVKAKAPGKDGYIE